MTIGCYRRRHGSAAGADRRQRGPGGRSAGGRAAGRNTRTGPPAEADGPVGEAADQGLIRLIRVSQFASDVRVPPQLPNGVASYSASVQLCPMYSLAIQMLRPSTAVAP